MKNNLNFLELFAGAGGLSEGFIETGFNPIAYVEQDHNCCLTLETRKVYYHLKNLNKLDVYYDYLSNKINREQLLTYVDIESSSLIINKEISMDTIDCIISQIKTKLNNNKVDVLLGGPPCQAYSLIGRAKNKDKQNDKRLFLYKHYLQFLKSFEPSLFVFENVPGLLSMNNGDLFKNILEDFESLGYHVKYRVLNSNNYGVLQSRKRVIVVGSKLNDFELQLDKVDSTKNLVNDLFEDLSPIAPGNSSKKYIKQPNEYLLNSKIRNKNDVLSLHDTRPHNDRDLQIYLLVIKHWQKHKQRIKYSELPVELRSHKNTSSFLDRYKVVAGDLKASHTMVAHISKDGHHYIHPDDKQCRSISVREAARIQSFPDNYFFEGPRTARFKQIGNAVPPLLSKALAKFIKEQI